VLTDELSHYRERHDENGGEHVAERERDEEIVEHRAQLAFPLHRSTYQHVAACKTSTCSATRVRWKRGTARIRCRAPRCRVVFDQSIH